MVKIREVQAVSIITRSKLPDSDFVINPYIGCLHGCKYCYANFMKKFTGHRTEDWGSFVDIKINAAEQLTANPTFYKDKIITIGSVTDPYQSTEHKYQLTRKILEKLLPYQPRLFIKTKSKLVIRDLDLIKKFKQCTVSISLSLLDDTIRKLFEPLASSVEQRIEALKTLCSAGINPVVFVSPILPKLSPWETIVSKTKPFVQEYWFENLNLYPSIRKGVFRALSLIDKRLVGEYEYIYSRESNYWAEEQKQIQHFCATYNIPYKIYFHHTSD